MPLEMNPEIRARWTAALRSGEYQQAKSALRDGEGRCCLGVLCELAVADNIIALAYDEESGSWMYGGEGSVLPGEVVAWAGLDDVNPAFPDADEIEFEDSDPETLGLAELNDYGWTFARIADGIDGGATS
jgi:hypothetical protein